MNSHSLSIGVIGAGIGGVAAAVALHRYGFPVTVYERAEELREVGAGLMLWPNATRVLKAFGLLDRVTSASGPNRHFLVRAGSGSILMNISTGRFDVPALCTRRTDLLDALISGLPCNSVRLGHTFESFEQQRTAVQVRFAGGVTAAHDILIGADGIRSAVRSRLLGVLKPVFRGYTVWRGIAHLPGAIASGSNSETWGRGRRFGILNTGGDRFTWYATANGPENHVDAPDGRQAELLRMFAGWHEPIERLIGATEPSAILRNAACDLPPLARWGRGRVTLLGDSAHPCTPNLGQGACMALEDALVLARSLQKESSVELALRRYEALRRERTRHVQQRSLLMGNIGQWENRLMTGGRRIVTRTLPAAIFERNLRKVYSYAA